MRAPLILLASVAIAQVAPPKPKASSKPAVASPKSAKPPQMAASKPATIVPATDEEKTIYALGLSIHRSLAKFDLSPHELDIVKQTLQPANLRLTWILGGRRFSHSRSSAGVELSSVRKRPRRLTSTKRPQNRALRKRRRASSIAKSDQEPAPLLRRATP
jgi:hypothetical protein